MKILHLSYGPGGVHAHLFHTIIEGCRAAGHEVCEAWLTGTVPAEYISPANHLVALGFAPRELTGLRRWFAARRMRAFLQRERFDVVITHRRKPAELVAQAGRGLPIRQRFAVWHSEREFERWSVRLRAARLFRDFTLIGVSDAVRDDILASGLRVRPEQVITINNSIDVDALEAQLITRESARSALNLPQDAFVFGTIGRLVQIKGHEELIRAFATTGGEFPRAHLAIVGDGPRRQHLEAVIDALHLRDRVTLTGAVTDAFRYARGFDAFLLPSYREGLSIALLEAACARLPCIASAVGGNRSVLGEFGLYAKPQDVASLAIAMRTLLRMNDAERLQLGDSIYRRLRAHFDRHIMMQAYADLIRP